MLPPESFRTPIPMLTEDSPYKSDGGDTDVKQEAGFPAMIEGSLKATRVEGNGAVTLALQRMHCFRTRNWYWCCPVPGNKTNR